MISANLGQQTYDTPQDHAVYLAALCTCATHLPRLNAKTV
jgi:hypothetical protein